MTWKRQGECNGCGMCCLFLAVSPQEISFTPEGLVGKDGQTDTHHTHVRGLVKGEDQLFHVPAWLYSPCSEYSLENMGCKIHETKPQTCKDYPWMPEQIVGTPCSYYFEKQNEAGVVFRQGGQASPYPGKSVEQNGTTLLDVEPYFNIPYPLIVPSELIATFHAKIQAQENTIRKLTMNMVDDVKEPA